MPKPKSSSNSAKLNQAVKQVIVARNDIHFSSGKLAAQVSHASVSSLEKADSKTVAAWKNSGQKKIVLQAPLPIILELRIKVKKAKLPYALISDAGFTELEPGTITCLGIGPADEHAINKVTGSLPLLK